MNDQPDPGTDARDRLSALMRELAPTPSPPQIPWADGRTARLVERWLPGGTRGVEGVRALAGKHRFVVVVALVVVAAAILMAVVLSGGQPTVEAAPALPPAISAAPAALTSDPPTSLVISVVGRVSRPGLVTVSNGARVADAIDAAGGLLPHTDDLALNQARRLTDGEQLYVGIPVPPGASTDPPGAAPAPPAEPTGKGGKPLPTGKIDLNTATEAQLESLPGVGPTTAGRILTWRTQHGHFDSINQLRDVGGIGDARFAKLENLVTT